MHFTIEFELHANVPQRPDVEGPGDYFDVYGSREVDIPALPVLGVGVHLKGGGFISGDIPRYIEMKEDSDDCLIQLYPGCFRPGKEVTSNDLPRIIGENPNDLVRPEWRKSVAELGGYISPSGWKIKVGSFGGLIA